MGSPGMWFEKYSDREIEQPWELWTRFQIWTLSSKFFHQNSRKAMTINILQQEFTKQSLPARAFPARAASRTLSLPS